MKITFVLPGNSASGGTRVTMQMGNCLLERGHTVRIAYRKKPLFSLQRFSSVARSLKIRFQGRSENCWLEHFKGKRQEFVKLEDLEFKDDEIVIATGPHTVPELRQLKRNVFKIGFCHGLLESETEIWKGNMDTIAVSPVHVPWLKYKCGTRVLGVVPNGICPDDYFVENRPREGVGFIFSSQSVKGPEVAVSLTKALSQKFSGVPCLAFGADRKWKTLSPVEYTRYPSVEEARAIYNRCKIWLVTSRAEGFCLPILEAMACGCAVISSKHTNAAQLIEDGVNGFVVSYGDITGYINLVERLLTDEKLRGKVVGEGFKTVRRYTWANAANRMEDVLAKVCSRPTAMVAGGC